MAFGKNLRRIRRAQDITQIELAKKVSITQSEISEYEQEKRMPGLYLAMSLARALQCTLDELVNGGGN